jgi:hypothetical protein
MPKWTVKTAIQGLLLLAGGALIYSGATQWHSYTSSSSGIKVAPPSGMDAQFGQVLDQWIARWKAAPRGANGLPLKEVGPIHTVSKLTPYAQRTKGNLMELRRTQTGNILFYEVLPKPVLILVTPKTFTLYSTGRGNGSLQMPPKTDGYYLFDVLDVMPSSMFTDPAPLQRQWSISLYGPPDDTKRAAGDFLNVVQEDTYAMADFKGEGKGAARAPALAALIGRAIVVPTADDIAKREARDR